MLLIFSDEYEKEKVGRISQDSSNCGRKERTGIHVKYLELLAHYIGSHHLKCNVTGVTAQITMGLF